MQCRCCSTNSLNRLSSRVPQSHWNALPKATHHQGFSGHSTASLYRRVRGNIKRGIILISFYWRTYHLPIWPARTYTLTGSLRGTLELSYFSEARQNQHCRQHKSREKAVVFPHLLLARRACSSAYWEGEKGSLFCCFLYVEVFGPFETQHIEANCHFASQKIRKIQFLWRKTRLIF